MSINFEINRLLNYGLQRELITKSDTRYSANRLIALLGLAEFSSEEVEETLPYPAEVIEKLSSFAVKQEIIEELQSSREIFECELMNCLVPRPSEVVDRFTELYEAAPKLATDYFYKLSQNSNYIRVDRTERDLRWEAETDYGNMIITINLSKPEKDPKDIAAAKNAPQAGYPKCALCIENEGFNGSASQAARANHRLVPVELKGEAWYMQYSPYVYYNEHSIVLCEEHRDMRVNRKSIERLLEFEEKFPHYFIGSNADLPIVGGSILTHDHFQAGCYEFPMARAGIRESLSFEGFGDISAGIVKWPMSVIRLRGTDKNKIAELAEKILNCWREYSDKEADVLAYSGDVPHNTITPIARRRDEDFELDLVLRNNRTTEEYPLGIFHPHEGYHHIKKENIGLIEVMGLAILPARLLNEMNLLKEALQNESEANVIMQSEPMQKHIPWYQSLKKCGVDEETEIRQDVGRIFCEILENSGVYKQTTDGMNAMKRFCEVVNES